MRVYTKEWHELSDYLTSVDMFEPIEDGDYSDEDIEKLHQKALENYLKEERELYDEPPYFDLKEWKEDNPKEDFDPEDYLIADITEDGEEVNFRNPESYEELLEYTKREYEHEIKEYEEREPFNEKEETELFEEMYNDSLGEPDEDIPAWVRETVDPRLIALGLLPKSIYKNLEEEKESKQKRFDELDEIADRVLEEYEDEESSEEYEDFEEKLSDMQSGYVLSAGKVGSSYEIEIVDWDYEDDDCEEDDEDDESEYPQVRRVFTFSNAGIIEDEGLVFESETDEDGDVLTNCELMDYELYEDNGRYEAHMLFDNSEHGLKYLTLSCDGLVAE